MKTRLRKLARSVLTADPVLRPMLRGATCIFLYHDVSDAPSRFSETFGLNAPPAVFERQIEAIRELFNVIGPAELLSGDYERPAALITFDDGFRSYFTTALPILERHDCHSLIFLNMSPVMGEVFWSGLICYLCRSVPDFMDYLRSELGDRMTPEPFLQCSPSLVEGYLAKADREAVYAAAREFYGEFATMADLEAASPGHCHFGNHLFNHFNSVEMTPDELDAAYRQNREALEGFPNSTELFSYPFGQPERCYNERTNAQIRALGARLIFSATGKISFNPPAVPPGALLHRFSGTERMHDGQELRYWLARQRLAQLGR